MLFPRFIVRTTKIPFIARATATTCTFSPCRGRCLLETTMAATALHTDAKNCFWRLKHYYASKPDNMLYIWKIRWQEAIMLDLGVYLYFRYASVYGIFHLWRKWFTKGVEHLNTQIMA